LQLESFKQTIHSNTFRIGAETSKIIPSITRWKHGSTLQAIIQSFCISQIRTLQCCWNGAFFQSGQYPEPECFRHSSHSCATFLFPALIFPYEVLYPRILSPRIPKLDALHGFKAHSQSEQRRKGGGNSHHCITSIDLAPIFR